MKEFYLKSGVSTQVFKRVSMIRNKIARKNVVFLGDVMTIK